MEQKVKDFYASKGLHIFKLIRRRPSDITPIRLEMAIEICYREIHQDGLKIDNINIVRHIWKIARDIEPTEYRAVSDDLATVQTLNESHEQTIRNKNKELTDTYSLLRHWRIRFVLVVIAFGSAIIYNFNEEIISWLLEMWQLLSNAL